jgi:hypothetical protein
MVSSKAIRDSEEMMLALEEKKTTMDVFAEVNKTMMMDLKTMDRTSLKIGGIWVGSRSLQGEG